MTKFTIFFGIDISKDTFDSIFHGGKHNVYQNNKSGFKELLCYLSENCHVVMEATGSYYQKLAIYLYQNNIKLSFVNPLAVK